MEINITWNVCRVCLEEENISTSKNADIENMRMRDIFSDNHTANSIYDCTNVRIKPNDSLPQKICSKCLLFLKHAVHFRNTCRNSNSYLQKIQLDFWKKANYTTSLFKTDKPRDVDFVGKIEDQNDLFTEEQSSLQSSQDLQELEGSTSKYSELNTIEKSVVAKDNTMDTELISKLEPQIDKFESIYENDENINQEQDLLAKNNEKIISPIIEQNLQFKAHDTTETKANVDLSQIFLSSDTELDQDEFNDSPNDYVSFTNSKENEIIEEEQNIDYEDEDEQNSHFLTIKNLEAPLNDEEAEEHAEMLETSSPVNIARNDANDELFFIYEHNVIQTKTDNIIPNDPKDDTILEEDISDIIETDANNDIDNENIEMIATDSNSLDSMEHIENDFVKCETVSRELTPKKEHDDIYVYEDNEDIILSPSNFHKKTKLENEISNGNSETFFYSKLVNPVKSIQNRLLDCQCPICGNQFHTRSLLKYHMRIHRNERNHECEICSKRFTTACNLTTHIRTHTGEKPFLCKYCDRRFADKSTLVKHERSHTDERPYSCNICQKAFSLSSSLRAHERIHSGEKPFSCEPCGKAFKLSHQLKAHLSTNSHRSRIDGELIMSNET